MRLGKNNQELILEDRSEIAFAHEAFQTSRELHEDGFVVFQEQDSAKLKTDLDYTCRRLVHALKFNELVGANENVLFDKTVKSLGREACFRWAQKEIILDSLRAVVNFSLDDAEMEIEIAQQMLSSYEGREAA